jgi:protein gp37
MPYPTPIEWTDATWTTAGGCSLVGPECTHCYAQKLSGTRLKHHPLYAGTTVQGKAGPVFNGHLTQAADNADVWTWPLRWRGAKKPKLGPGKPSLIFVDDMSDLFHEDRKRGVIDRTVQTIIHSRHIGQFLTKRPDVMFRFFRDQFPASHPQWPLLLSHAWLGFSAGGQRWFDERWPYMRELAAMGFTIFCSYEPAIGPLDLPKDFLMLGKRAQLIAGGESGKEPRPSHPDWFRRARDQCQDAGVAFFFKQWGEFQPTDVFGAGEGDPCVDGQWFARVGKKAAGRHLDGVEHDGFPEVQ